MAEQQDRPDEGPEGTPPAKKAAAKKAPAKKAAAKKAPAKKAPAKKAPAKKAPARKQSPPRPQPALTAGAEAPAALTAGRNGAREAAAKAKSSVQEAVAPPAGAHDSFGRGHRIPLSLGLAAAGLVALVISRLRRG